MLRRRGSVFASGEHSYRLSSNGLTVFPRLADTRDGSAFDAGTERLSTGIPALDDALGDGYWSGSATLVAGPSGAGKTLMGLHFLYAGVARDEPGILVTLQESRTQLARIIEGFGWSLTDHAVTVMDRSPVDVHIDELVYDLLDCVDEAGARRVVIDSLNDLLIAAGDPLRRSFSGAGTGITPETRPAARRKSGGTKTMGQPRPPVRKGWSRGRGGRLPAPLPGGRLL